MRSPLNPPVPVDKKFSESDTARRLAEANARIDLAIAKMDVLQWDENGNLIEIKCGSKPSAGNGKPKGNPE
jgi:hypothetical protein